MTENPYKSPSLATQGVAGTSQSIYSAIVLFVAASPMLMVGPAWLFLGAMGHRTSIYTPVGTVALALAAIAIAIGVRICFRANSVH